MVQIADYMYILQSKGKQRAPSDDEGSDKSDFGEMDVEEDNATAAKGKTAKTTTTKKATTSRGKKNLVSFSIAI
jgi:hypothetical protein